MGAVRQPDGEIETAGQLENAGHVVAVFMRHQHARQPGGFDTDFFQPRHRRPRGKTAVEQQPRVAGLDNQGIAPAAAAKRGETHHFNWS